MAQPAEAGGLNPPKYGFESHWGHRVNELFKGQIAGSQVMVNAMVGAILGMALAAAEE